MMSVSDAAARVAGDRARPRILCVDDEPLVLEGLARLLRRNFEVVTATGGLAGLEVLRANPDIAVVMSDMRMPGMDGATFLTEVRIARPDSVRLLLTGHSDIEAAIAAVNEGQIFRFLSKPCPHPMLLAAIDAAVAHVNRTPTQTHTKAAPGNNWLDFVPEDQHEAYRQRLARVLKSGSHEAYDVMIRGSSGEQVHFSAIIGPLRDGERIVGAVVAAQDVTELRRTQAENAAGQRLAAIGTLAAGVAHEINTPVQFVNDSMQFLRDASLDMFRLVGALRDVSDAARACSPSDPLREALSNAAGVEAEADLSYLEEHVPKAFARCTDGLERITSIVRSMKEFAHPTRSDMVHVDLNRAISSTLTIARNEYKYVADLETDLADLPEVCCTIGDVNQVVLNLVVNAAHAIAEVVKGTDQKGKIRVATRREGDEVVVEVSDTGCGIPEAIKDRIFEPFFTTKGIGEGTGQGLALAWSVVKERHGGSLRFDSRVGVGSTFWLRLPIDGASPRSSRASG